MLRRILALAFVGGLALAGCGAEPSPGEESRSGQELASGWEKLPGSPLSPRAGAVGVWTGAEVVVVGGETAACPPNADCVAPAEPPLSDGAAYNPSTRSWRRIADAPVPIAQARTAVSAGTVYFLVPDQGGRPATRAALLSYAPGDDVWAELPWPDGPRDQVGWYGLVAAAGELVAYSTTDERGERADYSYDTAEKAWSPLPDDPRTPAFDRNMVEAGGQIVLFDKELVADPGSAGPSLTRAAAFDPADGGWEPLPGSEILWAEPWLADDKLLVNPALGSAGGGEVNNWGREYPHGGSFDLAARAWSALPPAPDGPERSAGALGASRSMFTAHRGWVLDVAAHRWLEVPRIEGEADAVDGRTVVAAGRAMFVFGGVDWTEGGSGRLLGDAWLWPPRRS